MATNLETLNHKNELKKRRQELILKIKISNKKPCIFQTFENNNYETPILMARNSNSTTDTGS